MDAALSIRPTSSPLCDPAWEKLELQLFALTDQIEAQEGVPIEYAYHLAQMRLGMICEAPETAPVQETDEPNLLLY